MNLFKLYQFSKNYLKSKKIETYEEDAQYLISSILSISKYQIFTEKERKIPLNKLIKVLILLRKRAKKMPVAYILGYQYFYNKKFIVDKKTFIPKFDTEHLISAILQLNKEFHCILDVCTGSGVLAICLSKIFPSSRIIGIDKYIKVARKNAKLLESKNTEFFKIDFFKSKKYPFSGKFDLIVSNPPYLSEDDFKILSEESKKYEPFRAFWGGKDGLFFYEKIASFSIDFLLKNGYIVLEIDHKWEKVIEIFIRYGYNEKLISVIKDFNNFERVLVIRKDF